jgi:hypothetical protein
MVQGLISSLPGRSGNSTVVVNPRSACVRVTLIPFADSNALNVSANTIEYVKFPAKQSNADDAAMIHAVAFPRVFSQASA